MGFDFLFYVYTLHIYVQQIYHYKVNEASLILILCHYNTNDKYNHWKNVWSITIYVQIDVVTHN